MGEHCLLEGLLSADDMDDMCRNGNGVTNTYCVRYVYGLLQLSKQNPTGSFGSLADLLTKFTLVSAFGRKAVVYEPKTSIKIRDLLGQTLNVRFHR